MYHVKGLCFHTFLFSGTDGKKIITGKMNIFLLGATGGTGFEILKQLVRENHHVNTLVRTPSKLSLEGLNIADDQITIIEGDLFDVDNLSHHLENSDVIISALGTGTQNKYTEIYSEGGRSILHAMRKAGLKKLITITSAIIDMSDPSTDSFFYHRIIRPTYNKIYYDQVRWETILEENQNIDWICVRPPYLTDKGFTGKYRVRERHCPKGGSKISRADLADFIVKQIDSDQFKHKKPVIAY